MILCVFTYRHQQLLGLSYDWLSEVTPGQGYRSQYDANTQGGLSGTDKDRLDDFVWTKA